MQNFTPVSAAVGGVLIGASAALTLLLLGRLAGISSVLASVIGTPSPERRWRVAFSVGLLVGGSLLLLLHPTAFEFQDASPRALARLAVAGLLVGVGTRVGAGCTSGHGVCGLSRLSGRSLVATVTFMATAFVTVALARHVVGPILTRLS